MGIFDDDLNVVKNSEFQCPHLLKYIIMQLTSSGAFPPKK